MPKMASNEFQMKAKRITYAQKQLLKHECVAAHFRFLPLKCLPVEIKDTKTQQLRYASFRPIHSEYVSLYVHRTGMVSFLHYPIFNYIS